MTLETLIVALAQIHNKYGNMPIGISTVTTDGFRMIKQVGVGNGEIDGSVMQFCLLAAELVAECEGCALCMHGGVH
jgi:hypothetical protein